MLRTHILLSYRSTLHDKPSVAGFHYEFEAAIPQPQVSIQYNSVEAPMNKIRLLIAVIILLAGLLGITFT